MNKKEEAIKKKYGDAYDLVKPDENGWSEFDIIQLVFKTGYDIEKDLQFDPDFDGLRWRLKSLNGIENNFGWESTEKLPKKEGKYRFRSSAATQDVYFIKPPLTGGEKSFYSDTFTHWKPFIEDPDPIY